MVSSEAMQRATLMSFCIQCLRMTGRLFYLVNQTLKCTIQIILEAKAPAWVRLQTRSMFLHSASFESLLRFRVILTPRLKLQYLKESTVKLFHITPIDASPFWLFY